MDDTEYKIGRIRELIKLLRENAHEGHMPYVVDVLELLIDLLESERTL